MSLKTGEARERINLWTQKSCLGSGSAPGRRMTSPSPVVKKVEGIVEDDGGKMWSSKLAGDRVPRLSSCSGKSAILQAKSSLKASTRYG